MFLSATFTFRNFFIASLSSLAVAQICPKIKVNIYTYGNIYVRIVFSWKVDKSISQWSIRCFLYFFAFLFRYFPSPPLIFPGCHSVDMSQNELRYIIHMETGMSEKMAKH